VDTPRRGGARSRVAWAASPAAVAALAPDAAHGLATTRDRLSFLRARMGEAVGGMASFEEACAQTDRSRFAALPAFDAANRRNAYNVYLQMERESLGR
jgi:hypothetical protein